MPVYDRNSREKDLLLRQQLEALSPEDRIALKQQAQAELSKRGEGFMGKLGQSISNLTSQFAQQGGLKPQAQPSELDELIKLEKFKTERELNKVKLEEAQKEAAEQERLRGLYEGQGVPSAPTVEDIPTTATVRGAGPTPLTAGQVSTPQQASIPQEEIDVVVKTPEGKFKVEKKKNPEYHAWKKTTEKVAELDAKKLQLRKDLDSFFAVDSLIDRAPGGFIDTRMAGFKSQYKAVAQPLTKEGKPDVKGTAARVHDAARKRLRVQLVRAAGDVGNINIVEQEAAEKLIPGFFDSESSANVKNAYLREVSKAIESGDANAVRAALDNAGIGYVDIAPAENSFSSEAEAEAANLPSGTIVTINGRKARIE